MYTQLKKSSPNSSPTTSSINMAATFITSSKSNNNQNNISSNRKANNVKSELRESLIQEQQENGYNNNNNDYRKNKIVGSGSSSNHAENRDLELGTISMKHENGSLIMQSDDDPFYVFREDLLIKLEMMDDGLFRYKRFVESLGSTTAAPTQEIKECKKNLKRQIKQAESTLNDLNTTIKLVETKRNRFLHINDDELSNRKSFVSSSASRIQIVKSEIQSDKFKLNIFSPAASDKSTPKKPLRLTIQPTENEYNLVKSPPSSVTRMDNTKHVQNNTTNNNNNDSSSFLTNNNSSAQMMLQQQDETLDDLDAAVVRVGVIAGSIHEELGQQNKMLNDLEEDLDEAEEKLGLVMGKLGEMLKTKNKLQLGTIMCLSVIVVILFFLVLYS